jgi:hypothetical protein
MLKDEIEKKNQFEKSEKKTKSMKPIYNPTKNILEKL